MQTREQAIKVYDQELARVVNSLRSLADKVERTGQAHRDRVPRMEPHVTRVYAASEVQNEVAAWFGGHNSYLVVLWYAAIRAEYSNARCTPAELLDQAASGIQNGKGTIRLEDAEAVDLAEAALRGAGVIR